MKDYQLDMRVRDMATKAEICRSMATKLAASILTVLSF